MQLQDKSYVLLPYPPCFLTTGGAPKIPPTMWRFWSCHLSCVPYPYYQSG